MSQPAETPFTTTSQPTTYRTVSQLVDRSISKFKNGFTWSTYRNRIGFFVEFLDGDKITPYLLTCYNRHVNQQVEKEVIKPNTARARLHTVSSYDLLCPGWKNRAKACSTSPAAR